MKGQMRFIGVWSGEAPDQVEVYWAREDMPPRVFLRPYQAKILDILVASVQKKIGVKGLQLYKDGWGVRL